MITCIEPSHAEEGTAYVSASRYDWDDFHPYVYKTTDYGKHWTQITTGLPQDQYVESVRQDPDQANLLIAGSSATVYFSLDGGRQWQPLTLKLPGCLASTIRRCGCQQSSQSLTRGYLINVIGPFTPGVGSMEKAADTTASEDLTCATISR